MRVLISLVLPAILLGAANPERLARIVPRMQQFVDRGDTAGIVTLVMHQGRMVHHEAAGLLNRETKVPMARDSIFQVMSMTKPVTAAAILILAEEGRLALIDPVEKHLPEFRGQLLATGGRRVKPDRLITIRDLLTHTSGLAEVPPESMGAGGFYLKLDRSLAEAVTIYSQMPLQFQPGTRFQYSNPGIATLGRIIEVVSGQSYEDFLAQRIFQPLGMKDSFFYIPESHHARLAAVYQTVNGKLVNFGPWIFRKGARYPMPEGGLYSTAADMAAFYQAFLRRGKPILSKASYDTMTAIHTGNVQRGGTAWGLGWSIAQNPGGMLALRSVGSYGHAGAFGTFGWVDPSRDLVGVFLIQQFGNPVDTMQNTFVEMANAAIE